jgi:hypothetical protein
MNRKEDGMPKITKGGVSNRLVDEDFMSAPGVPVEKALDEGLEDVGQRSEDQPSKQGDRAATERKSDDRRDNESTKPRGAVDTTGDNGQRDNAETPGQSVTDPDNVKDAGPVKTPAKKAAPRIKSN